MMLSFALLKRDCASKFLNKLVLTSMQLQAALCSAEAEQDGLPMPPSMIMMTT